MHEEWRDIEGYEGLYQVSNLGNVKSLNYGRSKIRKPVHTKNGYIDMMLCKNGKCKHHLVHRLVAIAFIPNPDNLPFINHKDENKHNNRANNLEWCTREYNSNYGTRNNKAVKCIELDMYFNSVKEAGEWLAEQLVRNPLTCRSHISKCLRGKINTTGGYHWTYIDKPKNKTNKL